METNMVELVSMLIKALVDSPDEVEVSETKGEKVTIYEVRVAKEDRGKVIGRSGRTIEALRVIVNSCGAKRKQRCSFQIIDDEN